MKGLLARARRGGQISRAFFDMGYSTAIAYPITFAMSAIQALIPAFTFFFIAQLVADSPSVGGDYYSFVVIGFLITQAFGSALGGFTSEMQTAVQQGRFEMLLVEPVRWRLLPFGLAQWPIANRLVFVALAGGLSLLLGARFAWNGLPLALVLFILGLAASLAIGVISGAIGVLSKRSNPILTMYTLVAGILSGVAFPIELLPAPIRALSWLIPHTYAITGIRHLLLAEGQTVPGPTVGQALIALTLFNLLMYPIVMWAYGRIMETGRRTGVLSGY